LFLRFSTTLDTTHFVIYESLIFSLCVIYSHFKLTSPPSKFQNFFLKNRDPDYFAELQETVVGVSYWKPWA